MSGQARLNRMMGYFNFSNNLASVQVFRTYNASITLDRLLREQESERRDGVSTDEKKADYDLANKEVGGAGHHLNECYIYATALSSLPV